MKQLDNSQLLSKNDAKTNSIQNSIIMSDVFHNDKEELLLKIAPKELRLLKNEQSTIPLLAKNKTLVNMIEQTLPKLPTYHHFHRADSTKVRFLKPESVHLILTSPPYWSLKKYNDREGQLGDIKNYDVFLKELNKVWKKCYKALIPGGRLICVVGDVCLARRKNNGRHTVIPLHASIQEQCRIIGYDNLAPIIWNKISNTSHEALRNSSFLGKPYEPNAVIKNDVEFILMERKHGRYRSPSFIERVMSVISEENHRLWFNQIWTGLTGASTREHPAPYPIELATRLIRMFSFAGDTVLDPFHGYGTTAIAAKDAGRNSISIEVDELYFEKAIKRFEQNTASLYNTHQIKTFTH